MTPTPPRRTIAIIGLGLIGGSLARDLAALGHRVFGHDADAASLRRAESDGVLSGVLGDRFEEVREADLTIVATPVDRVGVVLERIAPHLAAGATVTDVGSTKATILASATVAGLAERFVGSHPLAGDHRSGWEASRPRLFHEATVYLCPTERTSAEALARVGALWADVGARCVRMDAATHDALMAWVSHLPQVAASAVAAVIADAGHTPAALGRGGRDVTRLASSSPAMWSAIARENAGPLGDAVHALVDQLSEIEAALRAGDHEALQRFFRHSHDWLA